MNKFNRVATTSERIKEALKLRDMRQTDLARITDIDKGSISSYISGRYEPKNEAVHKMANALSVSEMWLWGYDVPIERPTDRTAPTLGEIISAYRQEHNMSIEAFAKASGMTCDYVSTIEGMDTDTPSIPVKGYMKAAKAMGVNFAELMVATSDVDDIVTDMGRQLEHLETDDRDIIEFTLKNLSENNKNEPSERQVLLQLTEQEEYLVISFRGLNEDGREKAVERIDELLDVPKYQNEACDAYINANRFADKIKREHEKKEDRAPAKYTI